MKQILFFLAMARDQLINLMFIILGIAALFGLYRLFKLLGVTWKHVVSVVLSIVVMLLIALLLNIVTIVLLGIQMSAIIALIIALISLASLFISYGVIYRFLSKK